MMVCDASAIYKTIKSNRLELLVGQCTSSIAVYELGNVIWKHAVLVKTYDQKEANDLLNICEGILEGMRVVHSDLNDIYQMAEKFRTSFYDAAYLCLAADLNVPLVTLDKKLARKASGSVKIITFDRFIQGAL